MVYSYVLRMGLEDFNGCWKFQSGNDGSLGIISRQEGDTVKRVLGNLGHTDTIGYIFGGVKEIVKSLLMCKWYKSIAIVKLWQGREGELFILLPNIGPLKMLSTF